MSKRRKKRTNEKRAVVKEYWGSRLWRRIYGWGGLAGTIITLVGFYVLVVPRLEVSSQTPLDPNDPLVSVRFPAKNSGNFSLENVHGSCFLVSMQTAEGLSGDHDLVESGQRADVLEAGHQLDIDCGAKHFYNRLSITRATMLVTVTYRYFGLNFRKFFCFTARKSSAGFSWDADAVTPEMIQALDNLQATLAR